jgi:hypothetical protein
MKIEQTPNASTPRNVDPRPRSSMPVLVLVCGLCGVLLYVASAVFIPIALALLATMSVARSNSFSRGVA